MSRGEPRIADAGALAADYANVVIVRTTRDTHLSIARRIFTITNFFTRGRATSVQQSHDGIAGAVYSSIDGGLRVASKGLELAGRAGVTGRIEATPGGRFVISAVNGLVGDQIAIDRPALAIRLGVRVAGEDVRLDRDSIADAFADATDSIVVFMHGLSENESHWWRDAEEFDGSYGDRLARSTSWTPVYLRANTGLAIRENGAALAGLLDVLVANWPVRIRRIAFIGHSMGGLIVRAACAVNTYSPSPWTAKVTDVITLGTPHLGAPLAKGAEHSARGLGLLPETAAFGRILDLRSVGILGLRDGFGAEIPNLPHAKYRLVAATVTKSRGNVVGNLIGDALVRFTSATGRRNRELDGLFPGADVLHVPGAHHLQLLNHPYVYRALSTWLD